MKNITISILIPTYNEEKFIVNSLNSLLNQTIGPARYEILLIDGQSEDKTRELALEWSKNHSEINFRLIENSKKITPAAFNLGLENARGQFITLFGGHSTVKKDFLDKISDTFDKHPEVEACGGVVHTTHSENSPDAELIAYIWQHPFGVGRGMRTPEAVQEGYANAVAKITYRKDIFQTIGCFDELFVRNQDNDMNYRLLKNGGKIWLNPEIETTYYSRPTVTKMLKTAFYNSYFHSLFLKKHRVIPGIKYMIPAAFSLTFIFLFLMALLSLLGFFAFVTLVFVYVTAAVLSSLSFRRKKPRGFYFKMPLFFFGLHFIYGLGFIVGFLQFFVIKKKQIRSTLVKSR